MAKMLAEECISVPRLTAEAAVEILAALLERYQQPEVQVKLYSTYSCCDPRSLAYHERLSELLGPERERVLAKHGFPEGPEGHAALLIALAEFRGHPEVEMLTSCLDELLYTIEAPMVQGSENLSKRQVVRCCRAQIAAFSKADFQSELKELLKEGKACSGGSSELTLRLQRPILREYGLEANERGAHSLFHQVAMYIMDPDVAAYAMAVNALLGMGADALARFNRRLMRISMEDPGPKVARKEKPMVALLPLIVRYPDRPARSIPDDWVDAPSSMASPVFAAPRLTLEQVLAKQAKNAKKAQGRPTTAGAVARAQARGVRRGGHPIGASRLLAAF